MQRILNLVCPKCKHGIKHDTLTGTTTGIDLSEYPEKNEAGRYWCKKCQHGVDLNDDGLCLECVEKGLLTRLQPKLEKSDRALEEETVSVNTVDTTTQSLTLETVTPNRVSGGAPAKKVIGTVKDKKNKTSKGSV